MQRVTLLRRAGTHATFAAVGPGAAAHHAARGGALRSIRGTSGLARVEPFLLQPQIDLALDVTPFFGRAQHRDQFVEQR